MQMRELHLQYEDVVREVQMLNIANSELEKKQRRFDALLSEEKHHSLAAASERDALAVECREKETRNLSLTKE
jgi:hypothetical protein